MCVLSLDRVARPLPAEEPDRVRPGTHTEEEEEREDRVRPAHPRLGHLSLSLLEPLISSRKGVGVGSVQEQNDFPS